VIIGIGLVILIRKIRVRGSTNDGGSRVIRIYIEYNVIVIIIMVIERIIRGEREGAKRTMYRIIRIRVRMLMNIRAD